MGRRYEVNLEGALSFHSVIAAKARHGVRGFIKPFLHLMKGDDLFRKTGKWNRREKIEDRDRDRYFEHITDGETGELILHREEALSEHRGHGSAKHGSGNPGSTRIR